MTMKTPPFEALYVVKEKSKQAKIFKQLPQARAQVTRAVTPLHTPPYSSTRTALPLGTFKDDVELWQVGASGWHLIFSACKGDSHSIIDWENAVEKTARREREREARELARREAEERAQYEKLKAKFEGKK